MNSITFDTAPSMSDEFWFPPTTAPTKKGLYKRRVPRRHASPLEVWAWWDGRWWYAYSLTKKGALYYRDHKVKTTVKDLSWCGLARRAK